MQMHGGHHPDVDYLHEHFPFFHHKTMATIWDVKQGQVIQFLYKGMDMPKWVYVASPNWYNKLHGVDLMFITRRAFLPIVNAPKTYSEQDLYKKVISHPALREFDFYRTYDRTKMNNAFVFMYDGSLHAKPSAGGPHGHHG